MTDTFERLTAILIKDYKLSADKLTPDAPLEALGIDSLGTVELLWSVEDAFKIKLPTEPVPLTTLGDVVAYVDRLIAEQAAAPSTCRKPLPLRNRRLTRRRHEAGRGQRHRHRFATRQQHRRCVGRGTRRPVGHPPPRHRRLRAAERTDRGHRQLQ